MVNTHCTFGDFKKLHPEITGYQLYTYEDVPGFAKSGDALYGDCDDLIVRMWNEPHTNTLVIYLSN